LFRSIVGHRAADVIDPPVEDLLTAEGFASFFGTPRPVVWSGEPFIMNRRLTAQSGTFLVPGRLDCTVDSILARYAEPQAMLVKFTLPADKVRHTAMKQLFRMNITYATLFPDLFGLARSLAYELETNWTREAGSADPR